MKLIYTALVCACAYVCTTLNATAPPPWRRPAKGLDVWKEIVQPSFTIRAKGLFGSGTAIKVGGETLILTAGHVAEPAWGGKLPRPITLVRVRGESVQAWTGRVVAYSPFEQTDPTGVDLALIRPAGTPPFRAARMDEGIHLRTGETAWFIGTGGRVHHSLERTILSRIDARPTYEMPPDRTWIAVNGCGWYGHSGGGVFVERDGHAYLVGVMSCIASQDNPKTPILAVPPSRIWKFLSDYRRAKK